MANITLYFLQASRSIRIAWLLEELGLDYKFHTYDRESTGLAPDAFKKTCGTGLGKAPVLHDGSLVLQESGAITEYDSLLARCSPHSSSVAPSLTVCFQVSLRNL